MNLLSGKTDRNSLLTLALALLLSACGSDSQPQTAEQTENQTPTQITFSDIQASVFSPRCSTCHTGGGASLPAAMDLTSAEASFISLVSITSLNEPDFERVTPSNPDASYLIMKLEGTHNVGAQMPLGAMPLDEQTIATIRQWIASGATP